VRTTLALDDDLVRIAQEFTGELSDPEGPASQRFPVPQNWVPHRGTQGLMSLFLLAKVGNHEDRTPGTTKINYGSRIIFTKIPSGNSPSNK
jgi:hypothetical protein